MQVPCSVFRNSYDVLRPWWDFSSWFSPTHQQAGSRKKKAGHSFPISQVTQVICWETPAIAEPLHICVMAQLAFIPQMLQPKYWMNTEKKLCFPWEVEAWPLEPAFFVGSSGQRPGQGPSLIPNFTQAEFQSTVGSPQPWLVQPAVVGTCK